MQLRHFNAHPLDEKRVMKLFTADAYIARVSLIDLDALWDAGIRCLLLDRDNTCVARKTKQVPDDILAWIRKAQAAGFSICLVSNNFFSRDVAHTAQLLGVHKIDHAMKPAPWALHKAMHHVGVAKNEVVLIGDQVFTDVVAGKLSGISTILVRPLSVTDLFYTKLFRIVEHRILRSVHFEGETSPEGEASPEE